MMWNFDADDWNRMSEMMQKNGYGNIAWGNYIQIHWILGVVTWVLLIILLISLIRWVWKKGDKTR